MVPLFALSIAFSVICWLAQNSGQSVQSFERYPLVDRFRNAADSAPQFSDRKAYQLDVRNRSDAIACSKRCAEEGADLLMVKPGLTSLDLIAPINEATGLQVGAYQVSGEYAGLSLLADNGLIDFDRGLLETWHVFKRAGA